MALTLLKVKCAVCGKDVSLQHQTAATPSFEELAKQDKTTLGILDVQFCSQCGFASPDISKLEFASTRDILNTPLYRSVAHYFPNETEDPKGYLQRTLFARFCAYGLLCELNNQNFKAASAYWAASKEVFEASTNYLFDENNDHTEEDYLQVAHQLVLQKSKKLEEKAINLLQKEYALNNQNYEVFAALLVATAYAKEEDVLPLLTQAERMVQQNFTPEYFRTFLINKIATINESLH